MAFNGALITPDGNGQLPPASWVPQPGQPGMPAPGQNWQTPFAGAAQRGALPQPQPRMGQDGMMQMNQPPLPQGMQQPQQQPGFPPQANPMAQAPLGGWASPLAQAPNFPQGHPAMINSQGQPGSQQFQPQPQQQQQQPIANPWAQQPQLQQPMTQQLPAGWAPPQAPQAPQFQQPAQPQQQQAQQLGVFPNDPRIPQELRGQPIETGLQWYQGMRNAVLQMAAQPQLPAQRPTAGQQPTVQPAGAPASSTTPGQQPLNANDFFRNPQAALAPVIAQTVQDVINQQLMPVLAPVAAQSNMAAIQSARQTAAMTTPGFAQLEPGIMQMLAGVDPRMLTNPETWKMAAGRVMLDQMAAGQFRTGQPQQQPGSPWPPQAVAPGQNPLPNLNSFFTEQPGVVGQQPNQQAQLNPMQQFVAQQMGMSPEQYVAWQGGAGRR